MLLTRNFSASESAVAETSTQIETQITDAELSRRVLHIRSGWSVAERIQRRREAERRFADLLSRLATA